MTRAIYPGSFDPVTWGHLDIIQRSAAIVDELIIGILVNKGKTPLFSMEERLEMVKETTKQIPNVRVETFDGMTVDFARRNQAKVIIRGLRAVTDFEIEMQIAQTNRTVDPGIETVFLNTSLEFAFLSSTIVKEIASYHSDVSNYVPEAVEKKLREKFQG